MLQKKEKKINTAFWFPKSFDHFLWNSSLKSFSERKPDIIEWTRDSVYNGKYTDFGRTLENINILSENAEISVNRIKIVSANFLIHPY